MNTASNSENKGDALPAETPSASRPVENKTAAEEVTAPSADTASLDISLWVSSRLRPIGSLLNKRRVAN